MDVLMTIYDREYYAANKERILETRKIRYKFTRERQREVMKAYRERHKDEINEKRRGKGGYKGASNSALARKVSCINYLGGECSCCSVQYDGTNGAIFEFHHRDPQTKEFKISKPKAGCKWYEFGEELDKVDLLCANCHNLIHSKEF